MLALKTALSKAEAKLKRATTELKMFKQTSAADAQAKLSEISKLSAELQAAKNAEHALRQKLEDPERQAAPPYNVDSDVADLRQKLECLHAENNSLKQQMENHVLTDHHKAKELENLREELQRLSSLNDSLTQEIEHRNSTLTEHDGKVEKQLQTIHSLSEQLNALREENATLQAQQEVQQGRIPTSSVNESQALASSGDAVVPKDSLVEELLTEYQQVSDEKHKLEAKYKSVVAENDRLRENIERLSASSNQPTFPRQSPSPQGICHFLPAETGSHSNPQQQLQDTLKVSESRKGGTKSPSEAGEAVKHDLPGQTTRELEETSLALRKEQMLSNQLKQELESSVTRVQEEETKVEAMSNQLHELERSFQAALHDKEKQVLQLKQTLAEVHNRMKSDGQLTSQCEDSPTPFQAELGHLEQELQHSSLRYQQLEEKYEQDSQRQKNLTAELSNALSELQEQYERNRTEHDKLQHSYKQLRERLESQENYRTECVQREVESLKNTVERLESEKNALESTLKKELFSSIESHSATLESLAQRQEELYEANNLIMQLKQKIEDSREELSVLKSKLEERCSGHDSEGLAQAVEYTRELCQEVKRFSNEEIVAIRTENDELQNSLQQERDRGHRLREELREHMEKLQQEKQLSRELSHHIAELKQFFQNYQRIPHSAASDNLKALKEQKQELQHQLVAARQQLLEMEESRQKDRNEIKNLKMKITDLTTEVESPSNKDASEIESLKQQLSDEQNAHKLTKKLMDEEKSRMEMAMIRSLEAQIVKLKQVYHSQAVIERDLLATHQQLQHARKQLDTSNGVTAA